MSAKLPHAFAPSRPALPTSPVRAVNRVINDPNETAGDRLKGFIAAHPDLLVATGANDGLLRQWQVNR